MQTEFSTYQFQEIVWGKITGYPWWPGKIQSIQIKKNSQNLFGYEYKIHFFGDNSQYCTYKIVIISAYLAPQRIAKYDLKYTEYESKSYSNKKLRSSIKMANIFYSTTQDKNSYNMISKMKMEKSKEAESKINLIYDEHEEKLIQETSSNKQVEQQIQIVKTYKQKQETEQYDQIEIQKRKQMQERMRMKKEKRRFKLFNSENVIQLLQNGIIEKVKKMQDKEQGDKIRKKLKKCLLQKYNFNKKRKNNSKQIQQQHKLIRMSKKIHHNKVMKTKGKIIEKDLKKIYILKIYQHLKQQHIDYQISQKISIYLVEKLLELESSYFKYQFLNTIRWINNTCKQIIIDSYQNYSQSLFQSKQRFEDETTKTKDTQLILQV